MPGYDLDLWHFLAGKDVDPALTSDHPIHLVLSRRKRCGSPGRSTRLALACERPDINSAVIFSERNELSPQTN
jgi:hypothetical protein